MTHKEYAESLRLIADFFEQHEEIEIPHDAESFNYFQARSRSELGRLIRAFDGSCTKHYDESFRGSFDVRKKFGSITFKAICYRDTVCERIEVGKRTIPELVVPARPEEVIPAHDEPVYEWSCNDASLLEEATS